MRRNEGLGQKVFGGGSISSIDNGWEKKCELRRLTVSQKESSKDC